MALIRCSECGREISDKAGTCPNCGAPVSISTRPQHSERVEAEKKTVVCNVAKVFEILALIPAALVAIAGIVGLFHDAGMGFIFIVIALIWGGIVYLINKRTYVKIEDGIVTGHRGLIHTKKLVSPVSKVQDVSIGNGLFGKIFGYHTITISTAGSAGAEYVLSHMANAKEFQALFVELTK